MLVSKLPLIRHAHAVFDRQWSVSPPHVGQIAEVPRVNATTPGQVSGAAGRNRVAAQAHELRRHGHNKTKETKKPENQKPLEEMMKKRPKYKAADMRDASRQTLC
ncbi:hypothetical protein BKA81DRAFT_372311 [Phyllosticta paracitricarpa]